MVLGAAEGLHALAVLNCLELDVLRDRRRADEGDGLDVRVLQDAVDGDLVALHDVQHTLRQARLGGEFGQPVRRRRVLLGRLQDEGVAGRDGQREHPHRHHGREVERGDTRNYAQRLANRGHIDARRDLRRQLALELHADAAGEFDDLHAARDLAERVRVHLAVLGGDQLGDLVAVRVQQLAVLEQDRGALGERGGAPALERGLRGRDGGVHLVDGREADLLLLRAGRRVVHGTETARGALDGLAVDPVGDRLHDARAFRGRGVQRWRRRSATWRSYSSRACTADSREAVSATGTSHQASAGGAVGVAMSVST